MTDDPAEHAKTRRPGGRSAEVRTRILAATVELVARHGITGFSYEELAELAGVHKTSVYRNWPDREQLVSESLLQLAEDTVPMAESDDLREDLVNFLLALAEILATPRGRALSQVIQAAHDNDALRGTMQAIIERRVAVVRHRLNRAVEQGELPSVDPYFFAELLSGPVHLYLTRGFRSFARAEAERTVDVVLAGIRATAS